ncbi:Hint domain-containing protein [uncultured Roseobacter sp.]|uniref:Hint domain-containing protein n=1 Tax=uncultured Roseobacter sp. TaxID=114847 RepID=UPI002627C177|nr:Hint domain-containing protein [uncultured Roseobacter sp.]
MATWISIGSFADVDTTEGNTTSENAAALLGTYDNSVMSFVNATATDSNGDGVIWENDLGGAETITIDGVTSTLDSIQSYAATVTLGDGSTMLTSVGIAQLANGQAYVVPTDQTHLDNISIQSIELTSVENASYDGMYVSSASRSIDSSSVVCFASGTLIETDQGEIPVGALSPGARLRTLDRGFQPIRWIGSFTIPTTPRTCPIAIEKDALGPGIPSRTLMVSPQHRVFVNSKIAQRIFDHPEVLIPAKKLVGVPGIRSATEVARITYWHILLDRHEIIFSNGAPTESLFLGPMAEQILPDDMLQAARRSPAGPAGSSSAAEPARLFTRGKAQAKLAERHVKNQQAFVRLAAAELALPG